MYIFYLILSIFIIGIVYFIYTKKIKTNRKNQQLKHTTKEHFDYNTYRDCWTASRCQEFGDCCQEEETQNTTISNVPQITEAPRNTFVGLNY